MENPTGKISWFFQHIEGKYKEGGIQTKKYSIDKLALKYIFMKKSGEFGQ